MKGWTSLAQGLNDSWFFLLCMFLTTYHYYLNCLIQSVEVFKPFFLHLSTNTTFAPLVQRPHWESYVLLNLYRVKIFSCTNMWQSSWTRWGRVNNNGQCHNARMHWWRLSECLSLLYLLIRCFCKPFNQRQVTEVGEGLPKFNSLKYFIVLGYFIYIKLR